MNIDEAYRKQLTAERQTEKNGKRCWEAFGDNHLGDMEKMQEVLRDPNESDLDAIRWDETIAAEYLQPQKAAA